MRRAQVTEPADVRASGARDRKIMGVQISPWAQTFWVLNIHPERSEVKQI